MTTMKITKLFIIAVLPLSLGLFSCGDDNVNAYELGRTVDFPEMTAEARGTSNGETLAKALFSIRDTVVSAQKKNLVPVDENTGEQKLWDEPIFRGMLTSPLSLSQRPYELSIENQNDSLWMRGFNASLNANLKLSADKFTAVMKDLSQIDYTDIDSNENARLCMEIALALK
ncbi:MAG: hypothetical protein K6F48_12915 [Paludibacteraceae bacterium]|jgi:hypothetical protein|nr:hypothetical protein [Paludibacteraceae bacterium]